jgi:hypothetical protein
LQPISGFSQGWTLPKRAQKSTKDLKRSQKISKEHEGAQGSTKEHKEHMILKMTKTSHIFLISIANAIYNGF